MAKEQVEAPKKKRGLIARLFRFVAFMALLSAVGLVVGFKVQSNVVHNGQTIPAGQWAWDDVDGFQKYASYWFARTKRFGRQVKSEVKQLDQQYGVSKKAGELGAKAADKAGQVVDKVKGELNREPGQKAPEEVVDYEGQRATNFGYTDDQLAELPAGFFDELKAGYEQYEAARVHYGGSQTGMDDWAEHTKAARSHFDEAHGHFLKAQALYPQDGRVESLIGKIQDYKKDLSSRPLTY